MIIRKSDNMRERKKLIPKLPTFFSSHSCKYCFSLTVLLDSEGKHAPWCMTCRKVQ